MQRHYLPVIAAGSLVLLGMQAQAATLGPTFNAKVTLTPTCRVNLGATTLSDLDFGTYTPYTNAVVTRTTTASFQCSNNFSPSTLSLDSTVSAQASVNASIAGLSYALTIPALNFVADAAAVGGKKQDVVVTGVM